MAAQPTPAEVRKARKAQLVAWCGEYGLDAEGTVGTLRERILAHLKTPEEPAVEAAEEEAPAKAPEKREEKKKEEEEEAEEPAFSPKMKPKLDSATKSLLAMRRAIAKRRPTFLRQEWYRHPRLGEKWRKPQGQQSKLRRHLGYRINVVSVGYRGPRAVRGLHPSGFREVLVRTVRELEDLNPDVEAVRIAANVGARRRAEIEAAADEKGIRVLNRRVEE